MSRPASLGPFRADSAQPWAQAKNADLTERLRAIADLDGVLPATHHRCRGPGWVALAHDPRPIAVMGMLMLPLAMMIVLGLPLWLFYGRTAWKWKAAVATSLVALWILGFLGVLAMD